MKRLKDIFIPHEGNDHRPHILRPRVIGSICLLAVAAEAVFILGTTSFAPHSRLFGIVVVNALTDEANAARVANGQTALTVSPLLQAAAQEKANDMVAKNYFAHTSPTGVTPWYWFENVGYSFTYAGENLAVNFSDSQDVTNAWMNSPEHRANILNSNFTNIGIAVATGTYQGHSAVYVVELFGTPSPFGFPVAQAANAPSPTAVSPIAVSVVSTKVRAGVKVAPVPTPVVVAATSSETPDSAQTFVAVKGAETQTVPAKNPAVDTTPAVAQSRSVAPSQDQSNPIQLAAANPIAALDDFYILLALLFGFALALNIFIKIRIQYPNLILGGVVAISVLGVFILLNQQILLNAVIR